MIRSVRNLIILALALLVVWWLLGKMNMIPSFGTIFSARNVTIDETPVILNDIKSLSQIITITSYDEIIADTSAPATMKERMTNIINPFKLDKVVTQKKLIIIGRVITHVGLDLEQMKADAIRVKGDSISINLPKAKVLDIILNPSGTEVFLEEGNWTSNAVADLKSKITLLAEKQVREKNVFTQAEQKASQVISDFFRAAGYKHVQITFDDKRLE